MTYASIFSLKYGNAKAYLYLKRSGASIVAVGCICAANGHPLKDLGKFVHHRVPLFLEGLLEKHFDRISCSLIFIFFPHVRASGFAKNILQRFNQIDP
jgi:hypothetical protein